MYHIAPSAFEDALGIVEKTDTATHSIETGKFVIWKGHLVVATDDISIGDTLSSTNLDAVVGGGFNNLGGDEPGDSNEVGEIRMWSGSTAPAKWRICDGSVISRETYSDLFTVISTTYGGGDGSTTFAIPDFKGRSPLGVGESAATGHTAHTLGQKAGEETHVLSVGELASHGHSTSVSASASTSGKYKKTCASGSNQNRVDSSGTSSTNGPYTTTVSVSVTVNGNGSNTAHNTMHPYTSVNFIIYTGVEEAA